MGKGLDGPDHCRLPIADLLKCPTNFSLSTVELKLVDEIKVSGSFEASCLAALANKKF
jgi:hypothetical protein